MSHRYAVRSNSSVDIPSAASSRLTPLRNAHGTSAQRELAGGLRGKVELSRWTSQHSQRHHHFASAAGPFGIVPPSQDGYTRTQHVQAH